MATVVGESSSSSQEQTVEIASSQSESRTIELIIISSPPESHVAHINDSANFLLPSLELINDIGLYLEKCVPLRKVAMKGDWNAARRMIHEDNRLKNAAIVLEGKGTLLHVAAGGKNHVHFVEKLIQRLDRCDLELRDGKNNTAFFYAVASGNRKIAEMMVEINPSLPLMRGGENATPFYMAVSVGKNDMARYLYPLTSSAFVEDDWNPMFFRCIDNGLYDLALKMLKIRPMLALELNDNDETGLHVLARRPIDFTYQGRWYLQNPFMKSRVTPTPAPELVRSLWEKLLSSNCTETELRKVINPVTFDATEAGNFHFLAELMSSYPELIWEVDDRNRSAIHNAVLLRHSSIFNLIYEIGSIKDLIATFEDDEGNNMLHHAAKLAPAHQLRLISGAALQMTHEVLWFEEVEKIVLPSAVQKRNSKGQTPRELFEEEHKELSINAESWIKSTVENSMLVSTIIVTGVFAATFNLPGGRNNNTGTPSYLQKSAFLIFAISVAAALISSSASLLIFLSIFISSYAEDEYFRSLPFKLLFGLIAQLVAITSMMIAFSIAFFIAYYHGSNWVSSLIFLLAFMPIPLFTCVLSPLWSGIFHSSYFCMSLFRPRKQMLY